MRSTRLLVLGTAAGAALVLSACGGSGTPAASPTVTVTTTGHAQPSSSATPAAAVPPPIVAVTTAGALVTLNPATGAVASTLVPAGVLGDEISVSQTGMVYFAVKQGCSSEIEAIPAGGGTAADITAGSVPAVSPDGTKLAFTTQPSLTIGCSPSTTNLSALYRLVVRTLSTGSEVSFPMLPASQETGLPGPISHLSWAPDNDRVAVSVSQIEDNEGWQVDIVDTTQARYYMTGSGVTNVPVTGHPDTAASYLREAVFMPDGDLFVSRACCAGIPVRNTSRLMWEVTTAGAFVHQVAIGFPNLDHTSLDVSPDGSWLLYLAGGDLYVSHGGATPSELTTGLIAAAWS
jgi:WD40-like Beta Propeller Repeat